MTRREAAGLIAFIALPLAIGGLGAVATGPEIDGWYATIEKPTWNPPDRVFGPVWTTLYLLMGIAAWIIWKRRGFSGAKLPLGLFALQLLLNGAWSWIFFHQHEIGWAALEVSLLWLAILATTVAFFRISRLAGSLMLPYLAWVSFATALNVAIWRLN